MFGRLAVLAQSPHGKNFTMDCAKCHNSGGWKFDAKKANSTIAPQALRCRVSIRLLIVRHATQR
jgi:NAD-dependent SIR2 family protein deacetylase